MKSLSLGLACGLLLAVFSSAAAAQQAAASQGAATQVAKSDADTVVCKNQQVTGSRFPKRICHTKEQWARMQGDAQTMMRELNDRSLPVQGDGGGH